MNNQPKLRARHVPTGRREENRAGWDSADVDVATDSEVLGVRVFTKADGRAE